MSIETIALIKLPKSVFESLTRATEAASDPSRLRFAGAGGTSFEARLLDDGALVWTGVDFGDSPEAVVERLWELLGDHLADHDDDRGVFAVPSVAKVGGGSYEAVVQEIAEAGEWIALDDDEGDEDDGADAVGDAAGPGPDFMSMLANITSSLGPETLMGLQQAMMSGDAQAFERAQEKMAQTLSQRGDLVAQLQGLMGSLPPELASMAMNTSPQDLMRQMRDGTAPDLLTGAKKPADKGSKR